MMRVKERFLSREEMGGCMLKGCQCENACFDRDIFGNIDANGTEVSSDSLFFIRAIEL